MTANEILNDRYQLIKPIGRGSFGEVWMANDLRLDIKVAVKVYAALDGKGISDFKDEFKNVYKLHHPNLLRPDYFDTVGDNPYLVMPYCPKSADNLAGRMTEHELWLFISDVASGLAYLHDNDVIHRDIKPENILQDERGDYVISDFGLSTKMRSTLRQASMRQNDGFSGTIAYMAPELFTSKPTAVKATDVWALGVTIYEMATGELPFCGQGGCMLNSGAEIPELDSTKWSSSLNDVMRQCLAKETWDRPTAEDLVEYSKLVMNGDKRTWYQWKGGDTPGSISKSRLFRRIVILTTIPVLFSIGSYLFKTYKTKQEYSINENTTYSTADFLHNEGESILSITGSTFVNTDYDNKILTGFGDKLYASDIRYLCWRVNYNGPSVELTKKCQIKIFKPDGVLMTGESSPSGYTTERNITFLSGDNNTIEVVGWGNNNKSAYNAGTYKFELYCDGNKLYSSSVRLLNKEKNDEQF